MAITINGTGTITGISAGGLPSATVTQATLATPVAGTGPAFSVYMLNGSANLSVTSGVFTKVRLDTEDFDTNSNFDSTTNYRFTPTVAGYYQISGGVLCVGTTATNVQASIYKNGAAYKNSLSGVNSSTNAIGVVSAVVYFNGSTDYVELYGAITASSGPVISYGSSNTYFTGCLIRSA